VPLEFIVKELEKRGLNPVAYVVELTEDVAGAERVTLYLEVLTNSIRWGLVLEDRQAGEKLWNSITQLIKAFAGQGVCATTRTGLCGLWLGRGGRRGEGNVEVVKLSAAVELRDRPRELVAS